MGKADPHIHTEGLTWESLNEGIQLVTPGRNGFAAGEVMSRFVLYIRFGTYKPRVKHRFLWSPGCVAPLGRGTWQDPVLGETGSSLPGTSGDLFGP